MKKILLLVISLYGLALFGQERSVKKPEYVIIARDEIISQEKLESYGAQGYIKGMNKGVTQAERDRLAEKFGDRIGEKEFVIMIDLLTETEKIDPKKEPKPSAEPSPNKPEDELKLNVGDVARDFRVQMIRGEEITLSDLKGKVVLVNYWATWCAPCLMEFADIPEKILTPFENEDFVLIPIAIGENKEKVVQKMSQLTKYGIHFNVGVDPTQEIWNQYATGAIPKNYLIDKKGVIRFISIGNAAGNLDTLAIEITKLLAE